MLGSISTKSYNIRGVNKFAFWDIFSIFFEIIMVNTYNTCFNPMIILEYQNQGFNGQFENFLNFELLNPAVFPVELQFFSFSLWISTKQSSLYGDNKAAPLLGRRQPAIVSPCGQSPYKLHCFVEIQTEKMNSWQMPNPRALI